MRSGRFLLAGCNMIVSLHGVLDLVTRLPTGSTVRCEECYIRDLVNDIGNIVFQVSAQVLAAGIVTSSG